MEKGFQDNEDHYRALAINLDAVLFELDSQGYFTFASSSIEKLTKYSASEVRGLHFTRLVHPDDLLGMQFAFEQILGGSLEPHEFRVKNKEGKWRYIMVSSRARLDAGKPTGIMGVLTDITERKLALEALTKREAYFRTLAENSCDLIIVLTPDGQLRYISPAVERITGYSLETEQSQNILACIYPEDVLPAARLFARAARDPGYSGPEEVRLLHKDGSIRYAEVFCKNALDNPAIRGVIVNIRDVSSRKQVQDKQKQLDDELERASHLNSMGQMAAGVGHEINNPLTSIIGFSQLLERQNLPEETKEKIKVIGKEAKRIANVVQGLMTFARQEGLRKEHVDINDLLDQILKLRSYELSARNIHAIREFVPDLPRIAGDGAQLQQVFINLIVNAEEEITAARGQGHIWIKTETIPDGVRLSIRDDGLGIRPENMEKIFTPFFTTRGVGAGTGLGLSVCYGIISRHGGKIYAQSRFGDGATFIVELPAILRKETTLYNMSDEPST
jgi:two-component system NtrC family sensor kinase